jgi:hypothetical protein
MNDGRFVGYSIRSLDQFPDEKYAWLGPFLVHEYGSASQCQQAAQLRAIRQESPTNTVCDLFIGTYSELAILIEMKLASLCAPAVAAKYETQSSNSGAQAFQPEMQAPRPEANRYSESPSPYLLPNIAFLIYLLFRLYSA